MGKQEQKILMLEKDKTEEATLQEFLKRHKELFVKA